MNGPDVVVSIGPANCAAATGLPWRHLRDHARELGLRFVAVGGKRVFLAREVLAALEKRAPAKEEEPSDVDELSALRARLGKQRRSA